MQDQVLAAAAPAATGFYLTGGTALGRIYLRHRYSEDLDLFVNDDDRFGIWADRLLETWRSERSWRVSVQRRDPRFVRALVAKGDTEADALVGASSKAVGVFAADVARVLLGATAEDWRLVRWTAPVPTSEEFVGGLRALGEDLLLLR